MQNVVDMTKSQFTSKGLLPTSYTFLFGSQKSGTQIVFILQSLQRYHYDKSLNQKNDTLKTSPNDTSLSASIVLQVLYGPYFETLTSS